jgi:hypothetical protein
MPKRSRTKKPKDVNALAASIVEDATTEERAQAPVPPPAKKPTKNPAAVALGKLGGQKGGPARAKSLSAERRADIARRAARARWSKRDR